MQKRENTWKLASQEIKALKVLIVSDNMLRAGIRMILDSLPGLYKVSESSSSVSAVEFTTRERPEIVLIDLDLFSIDISTLIGDLHRASENTRVLALSSLGHEVAIREAFRAGAVGVVLKIQPPSVLVAAIETLSDRDPIANSIQSSTATRVLRQENRTEYEKEKIESLTIREREIIGLIGKGLRNKAIADHLCISETTVRHHLTTIFNKMEVSDRQKLLILAHHHHLIDLKLSS